LAESRAYALARNSNRRLIEIDLWEISVVTFPLLPVARVVAVKAAGPEARLATAIRAATTRLRAHLLRSQNP
jgi:phage head maturation protease